MGKVMLRFFRRIRAVVSAVFQPQFHCSLGAFGGPPTVGLRYGNTTFFGSPGSLKLGKNVFIGHFNFVEASNGITIGDGSQITNFITITTHSSHISLRLYGSSYRDIDEPIGYVKGPIEIGPYCFIGPNTVIMPNTKIGKGSIVAAFSYVSGEFPDFSVIAGNPARVVSSTKKLDFPFLEAHPDLKAHYEAWAGEP